MMHTGISDLLEPSHWFDGLIKSAINDLNDAFKAAMKSALQLIFTTAVPSPSNLQSHYFLTSVGGMLGLAQLVLRLVFIVVGFSVLLHALSRLSEANRLRASRLLTSMAWLVVFQIGFFPVYSIIYDLDRAAITAVIAWSTGSSNSNSVMTQLLALAMPSNLIGKLVMILLLAVFIAVCMLEALALFMILLVMVYVYPLVLALRPLAGRADKAFHMANAGIGSVLISPIVMIVFICLPLMVEKIKYVGEMGIVTEGAALIGGLLAACSPYFIWKWLYAGSQGMFGTVESNMSGSMDVGDMPTVTTEQLHEDDSERDSSMLGTFAKEMGVGMAAYKVADPDASMLDIAKSASFDAAGVALAAGSGGTTQAVGMLLGMVNNKKPSSKGQKGDA